MLKVFHEHGRYLVSKELGEYFGRVIRHEPDLTDDGKDELPRIREFDLHTFMAVHHDLPDVIDFDTVGHVTVNGRRSDALVG